MLKFLLDTNIAIYAIKNRHPSISTRFEQNAGQMGMSSIVVAELLFGAEKSQNPASSLAVVEALCSRLMVLEYGTQAAAHYGQIRAHLEKLGTPIGVNDMHIAGHARSEGLTVVSNNLREFERVPGLLMANWLTDT